jgi:hypothetical protein
MLTLIRTHPVKPWIPWQLGAVAIFATSAAHANDELIRMSQNPKNWVMPTGNYANHRYSQLKQITADKSASCRWRGRFRPAFCVAMKAVRW